MRRQDSVRPPRWLTPLLRKTLPPRFDRVLEARRRSAVRRVLSRKTLYAFRVHVFQPRRRMRGFARIASMISGQRTNRCWLIVRSSRRELCVVLAASFANACRAFACSGLLLHRFPVFRRVELPGKPERLAQCLLLWRRSKDLRTLQL